MFKKGISAYTWVMSAVTVGPYHLNKNIERIYPKNRLAIVGTPYHNVCPASFFTLLNDAMNFVLNYQYDTNVTVKLIISFGIIPILLLNYLP
jgi:hypothetical protein